LVAGKFFKTAANDAYFQLEPLVQRFGEYLLEQSVYVHAFGLK
jgi:hypothetical protein